MTTAPAPLLDSRDLDVPENVLSKDVSRRRTRSALPSEVDVAIIGAGPAGLVAGAYLTRAGIRVALFDSHYVAGGCATVFSRAGLVPSDDGVPTAGHYHFDVGLHYVGDCIEGMIPRLLAGAGIHQRFLPMDPDGFDTLIFPDFEFRIPVGLDAFRARLYATFPDERRGIDRYISLLAGVDRLGRAGERRDRSKLAMAFAGARSVTALRNMQSTIGTFLDGCTKNPRLKAVLLGQSGDYGLPPSEASALLHAGLSNHYFRGAYYPEGGGQILSDKLAETIEAAGGQIHLRCGIDQILVDTSGRACGVRTEARRGVVSEVRARVVLSGADLKRTLLEMVPPDALPAESRRRAEKMVMGGAIFMTFLGVKGRMTDLGMRNANYWQFDTLDMDALYRDNRARPVGELKASAAYITSASVKDPGSAHHAPAGAQTLEIMTLVPGEPERWGVAKDAVSSWTYKRSDAYKEQKARIEADLIGRVEALFPCVKDRIIYRESATPVTHSRFTRASDGTGYGLAATPDQFLKGRPGYRGPIPGLYVCGASTRSGHGIVGAMMSGWHAAKRVADELGRQVAAP